MTAPNMATITASLERSLQNCSLNHHHHQAESGNSGAGTAADLSRSSSPDAALDLNSQLSLPYHWEQCLDLKSGEVYYINWRTGTKSKEDPRTTVSSGGELSGEFYSEDDDDDDSSYEDSDESSSQSSPSYSRQQYCHNNEEEEDGDGSNGVLVVAGCKSCLMYFMVPKQVEDCPKCSGQLLHFDRGSDN